MVELDQLDIQYNLASLRGVHMHVACRHAHVNFLLHSVGGNFPFGLASKFCAYSTASMRAHIHVYSTCTCITQAHALHPGQAKLNFVIFCPNTMYIRALAKLLASKFGCICYVAALHC